MIIKKGMPILNSDKKKILILTDSLGLPRDKPEYCSYEETWPVLLKQYFHVHQVSLGGGTIKQISRQVEYHKLFQPHFVILQSGIVDCAPRAFTELELQIIKGLKPLNRVLEPLIKKNAQLIRRVRKKSYTGKGTFKSTAQKLISQFPGSEVFAMGILPVSDGYERQIKGITNRVKEYNRILSDVYASHFISNDDITPDAVMSDHIHLNTKGHAFIFDKVLLHIEKHA